MINATYLQKFFIVNSKNPSDYQLSDKMNQNYFEKYILKKLEQRFEMKTSKEPMAYFTAGLPGAGKSKILHQWEQEKKDILVIDVDEFRKEHPFNTKILERFGTQASEVTQKDASKWAMLTRNEALQHKIDYILDSTMRNPKSAEFEIKKAQKKGYSVEVKMLAVNEFESLEGVFNRYAMQYQHNSKEARFVDPSLVLESKDSILQSIDSIDKLKIDKFTIVNREMEILYDQNKSYQQSAKEIIQEKTDLKNWDKSKIDKLVENWDKVLTKLENIKAPQTIQESAKHIKKDLIEQLKSLQKNRPKFNEQKRNQVLEKLEKGKEKNIGIER